MTDTITQPVSERNHVIQFHPDVIQELNQLLIDATDIWAECEPDLSGVQFASGNYAGYGAYVARCHKTGLIEIPIGNGFTLLRVKRDCQLVHAREDKRRFQGTVLHEVGHHVVNTAKLKPWEDWPQIGPSTHMNNAWLWICCTAWEHFEFVVDEHLMCRAATDDEQHEYIVDSLTRFNPFFPPPAIVEPKPLMVVCKQCGETKPARRKSKKFCTDRCRARHKRERRQLPVPASLADTKAAIAEINRI